MRASMAQSMTRHLIEIGGITMITFMTTGTTPTTTIPIIASAMVIPMARTGVLGTTIDHPVKTSARSFPA